MDFGDGRGTLSESVTISVLRDLRFSLDPNGANSITLVYRYNRKALNLQWKRQRDTRKIHHLHSRHKRHVRNFDNLPLLNAILVLFT